MKSGSAGFGIGWRHAHYAQVLQERPALDFLEVHSENFFAPGGAALATLLKAREYYPISLHGVGLALGSASGLDAWHLDQLARLVEVTQPLRVSDHACFARAPWQGQTVHAADLLPVPFTPTALDVMCQHVHQVQERLRHPLLVENLSSYVHFDEAQMSEPEFLNALAARTGCGLLVDVNNIYVNACNAQKRQPGLQPLPRCQDWLDAIDARYVAELHLAGHCDLGDIVIDDHGSGVCDPVWQLYAQAAQRFDLADTLIEWDTNLPELSVLLLEVQRARQTAGTPPAHALALA